MCLWDTLESKRFTNIIILLLEKILQPWMSLLLIIFLNIYFQESLGENKFISYDLHGLYKSMPPTPKVPPIGSTSLSPN